MQSLFAIEKSSFFLSGTPVFLSGPATKTKTFFVASLIGCHNKISFWTFVCIISKHFVENRCDFFFKYKDGDKFKEI